MIVLDANILLYAYDASSQLHEKARAWVEQLFSDGTAVGLPWQTVAAFLRITTHPRLPGSRLSAEEATQIVEAWLDQPNVRLLAPGDQHWPVLRKMVIDGQARGPLVSDAHLAALTAEYGGILQTTDRDFARFPALRWANPLA